MTKTICFISIFLIALFARVSGDTAFADSCEIISYNVREEIFGTFPLIGSRIPVTKRQCVDVTIRNLGSTGHQVKDASIKVVYENSTYEIRQMMPVKSADSENVLIGAGERYDGKACFEGSAPIAEVECSFDSFPQQKRY